MKQKLFYTLRSDTQHIGGTMYKHAIMDVFTSGGKYLSPTLHLQMQWQSDNGNNTENWYGFHIELEKAETFGVLDGRVKVAKHIERMFNGAGHRMDDLKAVVNAFKAKGIKRMVYDRRDYGDNGYYVPIDEIQPAEYKRYMAWVNHSNQHSVVAVNEEDAQRMILKEWAGKIGDGIYSASTFEKWIADGKPVKIDDYATYPDYDAEEAIITPLGTKKEEVAA